MSEEGDTLRDVEVAVTGRLASMPREEAVLRIAAAGGRYVEEPSATTALLVVGEAGPPLGEDGRLTAKLRRARELQETGAPLAVVREEELLARLGLAEHRAGLRRLFTTAQLGRILGVPQGRIRSWVRYGLIEPVKRVRRLEQFDFAQVTSARKLLELTAGGVTPARLRKSLEQLHAWRLGAEPSLAQLERLGSGGPLLVRLDDGSLVEPSGQLVLDWDEEEAAADGDAGAPPARAGAASLPSHPASVGPLPPSERAAGSLRTSAESSHRGDDAAVPEAAPPSPDAERERWFETGVALEEAGRLERAARAYRRALAAADARPEIHFNLGNVVYALERPAEAADHFFQAVELDPDYVEAWNNLGNALADLDRTDDALGAYRQALAIEPRYADAHYNLAQLLIRLGSPHTARTHLLAYLAEDPASSWAAEVRRILAAIR